ncbi:MAG: heparinase II/III family protein [Acidobacteria bacterium]|nr:heparinase II/III family protein [Acidobacteriota bacterium]
MNVRPLLFLAAFGGLLAAQPRLLSPDDIARMRDIAGSIKWAADARAALLSSVDNWPKSHVDRFGLRAMAIPEEGGQWPHYYVCPVHGVSLQFQAPATHRCTVDNRTYSGWPYDQVILMRRHDDLSVAARNNALAFRMTGEQRYAEAAAWILRQYAGKYLGYPLKDVNNRNTRSAARASAQTLDESVWLIPLAYAYDLLAGSDALTAQDRSDIENNLLRGAVEVIQRYDAGVSNWQSWHNGAIGAVGFALGDQALIDAAIDGKSGFRFQMQKSILGEGFWYEGAWSYHFYALDPLVTLAEIAARNGTDLWGIPQLKGMFAAPLQLAFPDATLPAFNDSGAVNLASAARLYESAYTHYGDDLFAAVARRGARGREAWMFGTPELPAASFDQLASAVFPDSGYAVLRAPSTDHTVIMKFGPHGGGHGHYDKLGMVSFGNGGILAVDPGTQSYAAPTHGTWDQLTVAHNTVVVDQQTQAQATGRLLWSDFGEGFRAARADAGSAYAGVRMDRTMLVTDQYTVDVFRAQATDGRARRFDWVYHNGGTVTSELDLKPYTGFPGANGYQHLTSNRAAETDGAWQLTFDGTPRTPVNTGSVFASTGAVRGTFQITNEQVTDGRHSGKLGYEFNGAGYLLYSAPVTVEQPTKAPEGLRVMVYGDGSGHTLALRLNDATDERFVRTVGAVNWTGWKTMEVGDVSTWTHYLGNDDGVVDLPVKSVSFEWQQLSGGPRTGALFVDRLTLLYDDEERLSTAFELRGRSLRVWMLAGPATTVVTGNGLGPNLLVPVPYVMARRGGTGTEFVSLLEPFTTAPGVQSFERQDDGWFVVKGVDFEDRFYLGDSGVTGFERVQLGGN